MYIGRTLRIGSIRGHVNGTRGHVLVSGTTRGHAVSVSGTTRAHDISKKSSNGR